MDNRHFGGPRPLPGCRPSFGDLEFSAAEINELLKRLVKMQDVEGLVSGVNIVNIENHELLQPGNLTLEDLGAARLENMNDVFVPWQGSAYATRNYLPALLRRKGISISYVTDKGIAVKERAVSDVGIDNANWGIDSNWMRVDELSLNGKLYVSPNGTWVINGVDTGIQALGPKGDNGLTPRLKTIDNKLHYSYDGVNWEVTSEHIAAWFRWSGNKIQISRDNKTWEDLSGEFADNLFIKGYVATFDKLPAAAVQGDIWGVGPVYAVDDAEQTNPRYRYYVRNAGGWVDNGEFTSIAAGIVQETGDGENVVMSQAAVSREITELGSEVTRFNADIYNTVALSMGGINIGYKLTDDATRVRTSYISGKFSIKVNDGYSILYLFKYSISINGLISPYAYSTINATDYTSSDSEVIYRLVFSKNDGSEFSEDELKDVVLSFIGKKDSETTYNNLYMWEQGGILADTSKLYNTPKRIRCWVWANTKIEVKEGYLIRFLFYKTSDGLYDYQTISSRSVVCGHDGYVVVAKSDDSSLTPNDDFLELFNSPIRNLIPQFGDFDTYYVPFFNWVQGGILSTGAEPTAGQAYYDDRIKTNNPILSQGEIITFVVNSDYKVRAFQYSSEMTFESYLGEFTNNQTLETISGNYYRFVLLRNDDGDISVEESVNCNIIGFYADTSNGELRYTRPLYSVPLRNNLKDKRVAFLGDSITQGASATSQTQTYHGVFCSLYGAIDRTAELYNERGSSSNNLLGMNGTCIAANTKNGLGSKRFVTRATAENFADSKLIVVFGGTNDLSYDSKAIGDLFVKETIAATGNMGTQRLTKPTDTETFAGALHELITTIQNVAPKVPIVFMTPMKRDHNSAQNPDYLTCNSNGDYMIDYVNAIKEICAFYSIPVLDMYSNSQLNPLAPGWSNLFGDGLHPNDEGHSLIGELLFRFVEDNVIV